MFAIFDENGITDVVDDLIQVLPGFVERLFGLSPFGDILSHSHIALSLSIAVCDRKSAGPYIPDGSIGPDDSIFKIKALPAIQVCSDGQHACPVVRMNWIQEGPRLAYDATPGISIDALESRAEICCDHFHHIKYPKDLIYGF